jgi:predicted anti-sigma-YlaC factor YlaD
MITDTTHDTPALIDCETAARALYDYLDGRLPQATMESVRHHVEICTACAGHYRFARRVLDLVPASLPLTDPTHALRMKVVAALRSEGYAGEHGAE